VHKKAFQFGAGNIGRGFLGQLFFESGYHTTFIDVVPEIIHLLNQRHEYPIRIVSDTSTTITVSNVSAVSASDTAAVAAVVAESEIGATAVGVNVLPKIAPLLAEGISRRFEKTDAPPLNIIVCENLLNAGPYLREQVRQHLPDKYHAALHEKVGFVEASIGRMVPIMTEREKAEDPLLICVEPYCDLPVDAAGFKGPIPNILHMHPMNNFGAYVKRKLFVHNMSHAVAAYLGYLKGHKYIWQAVTDPSVRSIVRAALNETCAGLSAKHGLDRAALDAHAEDLLRRYENRALGDQITRIAKDPVRKLGPRDRLIGSCLMCLEQGIVPSHVAMGAAAALFYDHPDDSAAQEIQELRESEGVEGVLQKICRIDTNSHLAWLIFYAIDRLRKEQWLKSP